MKHIKRLIILATLCMTPFVAQAASATFAWDASTSLNITNYSLYIGNASGVYNISTNKLGITLTTVVNNFVEGQTYYLAATATDMYGMESYFSNELVYTVSRTRPMAPGNLRRTAP